MKNKFPILSLGLLFLLTLFFGVINSGEIDLSPFYELLNMNGQTTKSYVFWSIRFPLALMALTAGASLGIAGQLMQTFFRNPLAGPYVLGIHSGASLGVASSILLGFSFGDFGTGVMALFGALMTLFCLIFMSYKIESGVILLIIGLLFSHLSTGILNLFILMAEADRLKIFLLWGQGSFGRLFGAELYWFFSFSLFCICCSFFLSGTLDMWQLGNDQARSLGLNIKKTQVFILILVGLLTGPLIAFCGPVSFIGLLAPHIVRKILKTSSHIWLLSGSSIMGGLMALLAQFIISNLKYSIPLNALMGFLGAPTLIFMIWSSRQKGNI